MKKILLAAVLTLGVGMAHAQAPEKMSYQAVLRNNAGQLLSNQNVAIRVSILQGSEVGTVVYSERLTGITNVNGLLTSTIGSGTVLSGAFNTINWSTGNYYLKTETDPSGGTNYTIAGTSQLLSVPYAMYAKNAGAGGGGGFTLPYSQSVNSTNPLFSIQNTGSGHGIVSTTGSGFSLQGVTSAQISVGVFGENNGNGEAIYGRTASNIAGAVVGRNEGSGYGVHGFITGDTTGDAIGVYGRAGINSGKGKAGKFTNINSSNDFNTLEVETNTIGHPDRILGNAASIKINNIGSIGSAVKGEVNTIYGNFAASGIYGVTKGTGGYGGVFHVSQPTSTGKAVLAINEGNGDGILTYALKGGDALEAISEGSGRAIYATTNTTSTGKAGVFENHNTNNESTVLSVNNVGKGAGATFNIENVNNLKAAVYGKTNTQFSNYGAAGVYGEASGLGGYAGLFHASRNNGNGNAILAISDGNGDAIRSYVSGSGDGVETSTDGTGSAIYATTSTISNGRAARFVNLNLSNAQPVVHATTYGTGTVFYANHLGNSGNLAIFQNNSSNVARINRDGRAYFNGGTQTNGADVAEIFDIEGDISHYEMGDVLVISSSSDRAVEKSSEPYSTLVAGVYATKPGVLLAEEHIDADLSGKVPMGVIGVIPTKVSLEGGAIKRGDLLVTSSTPGVAMKADLEKVKVGQVIGKALQNHSENSIEKINVLVSVK